MSFPGSLRRELIRALRNHRAFADTNELRSILRSALCDLPRGADIVSGLNLSNESGENALEIVLRLRDMGRGSKNALARILEVLLETELSEQQSLVFCAVFEALAFYGRRRRLSAKKPAGDNGPPTPKRGLRVVPPPSQVFTMVSYAREDESEVKGLIESLRARGITVEWALECPDDTDWPLWVIARFAAANHVILACSPSYMSRYQAQLKAPFQRAQPRRGISQEIRLMAYEYFVRGPSRLIPVLLDGASRKEHIPLVVGGYEPLRAREDAELISRGLRPKFEMQNISEAGIFPQAFEARRHSWKNS